MDVVSFFYWEFVGNVFFFELRGLRVRGRLAIWNAKNAVCRVDSEEVFFEDGLEFDL